MTRKVYRGQAPVEQDSSCAACGEVGKNLLTQTCGGVLLQLCSDIAPCTSRYRKGLTPSGYQNYLRAMAAVQIPSDR